MTAATAAEPAIVFGNLPYHRFPPWFDVANPSPFTTIVDRRRVPSLGPLRPEGLAQPRGDRPRPVIAEDAPVDARGRHDAAGRGRQEDLVRLAQLRRRQRADVEAECRAPAHSSWTESRVMPSSEPRSGVATAPSVTAKTLKPGPSVTKPSRSSRTQLSAPRSSASNRPRVRSPQWKFLTLGSTELVGDARRLRDDEMSAARLHLGRDDPDPGDREGGDVVAAIDGMARQVRLRACRAGNPSRHRPRAGPCGARIRRGRSRMSSSDSGGSSRSARIELRKRLMWSSRRKNAPPQTPTTS